MDVNITPFESETKTRYGEMVRADVYITRLVARIESRAILTTRARYVCKT
jgi:hypothetical protein